MMKFFIYLLVVFCSFCSREELNAGNKKANLIIVKKADRKMMLYVNDEIIKTYKVSLGTQPIGHKGQEGDGKTPEGRYTIAYKNAASRFHKSLKISYPNKIDCKHAKKLGVSPGGDVMIHGLGKEFSYPSTLHTSHDWTLGCIAVTNEEMDEIWLLVEAGTVIQIDP